MAFTGDIYDYAEANASAGIDDIYKHFGTPQKTADEILAAMEPSAIRHYLKQNYVMRLMAIVLSVLVLGACVTYAVEKICYAANGNPVVIIEKAVEVDSIPTDAVTESEQRS